MEGVCEDFEEDDVWAVTREKKERSPRSAKEPTFPAPRRLPTAGRTISASASHADANGGVGCCSGVKGFQQSAPVNIPDWAKIYGRKCFSEGRGRGGATDGHEDHEASSTLDVGDDDNEDDSGVMPPHEWVARKLARSQISSFSVCEGVGRTLKGRDLSRVRNAVLSRTGFLE